MIKVNVKNFKEFSRINEDRDEELPFRLYGEGSTPEAELIESIKSLVEDIKKSSPSDQDEYDAIKSDIKSKTAAIKSHGSYPELVRGIEWQDTFISLSDFASELKEAVGILSAKTNKKGLT